MWIARWLQRFGLAAPAYRVYKRLRAVDPRGRRAAWQQVGATSDGVPVPPASLLMRVAGSADRRWFLEGGRLAAGSMHATLQSHGVELGAMQALLDFGCGCGRTLRHWQALDGPVLHGTDYDAAAIAWCQAHLPFAQCQTNQLQPPLHYDAASFDLVYALSVLTHLPEALQQAWLHELTRVLRPGGWLLLTLQGAHYRDVLSPHKRQRFAAGELVVRHAGAPGTNLCAAFHPEAYVRQRMAAGLEIIDYLPEAALGNPFQDIVLLRNPLPGRP